MSTTVATPGIGAPIGPEDSPLEPVGRALGVPTLGEAPWGTHFCLFFAGVEDLLEMLIPHFRAGLENNELCTLSTLGELDRDATIEALARGIDGFEARLASGQMTIRTDPPPRPNGGPPDCPRLLTGILNRIEHARDHGHAGYRGFGVATWLQRPDWDPYMAYEADLTRRVAGTRGLVTCGYSLPNCDASQLVAVLMTHQFALLRHGSWTLIEPSERKRATEAVERMNLALAERTAQLQSALTELGGFSRWVTHDLRIPLTSIAAFTEELAETAGGKLDAQERARLDRVRDSAAWMDRLIAAVLAYSEAQHAPVQVRPLDLRALVREVWPAVAADGDAAGRVNLRVSDLPLGYGDPVLVSQVLEALLRNAATAVARRPDPLIEVGAAEAEGGEVAYVVRDNGVGFDPAYADAIFDPFTRLHSVNAPASTGLGLAVVKEIIGRHGGRVWAQGEPGAGATVWFTLPVPPGASPPADAG